VGGLSHISLPASARLRERVDVSRSRSYPRRDGSGRATAAAIRIDEDALVTPPHRSGRRQWRGVRGAHARDARGAGGTQDEAPERLQRVAPEGLRGRCLFYTDAGRGEHGWQKEGEEEKGENTDGGLRTVQHDHLLIARQSRAGIGGSRELIVPRSVPHRAIQRIVSGRVGRRSAVLRVSPNSSAIGLPDID